MHKIAILSLATFVASASLSSAAHFADSVISYDLGTGGYLTDPSAALGQPGPNVDPGGAYPTVFSPFSPHFQPTELFQIGTGGQLTLKLSVTVYIDHVLGGQRELGIWSNVGLQDSDYPNGTTDPVVGTFSDPDSAIVEVSADGAAWYSLQGGSAIVFNLPGNYFLNAGPQDPAAPADPQYADFGKPFLGTLSDFNDKTYPEILALLDGSAGGTWLDLDSVPLATVNYVRLSNPSGDPLAINAVAVNNLVPEPGSTALLLLGLFIPFSKRHRRAD